MIHRDSALGISRYISGLSEYAGVYKDNVFVLGVYEKTATSAVYQDGIVYQDNIYDSAVFDNDYSAAVYDPGVYEDTMLGNVYFENSLNHELSNPPTGNYIVLSLFGLVTDTLSLGRTNVSQGLVQLMASAGPENGMVECFSLASKAAAAFPRDTTITEGTTTLRIDAPADMAPPMQVANGMYSIPVTISFKIYKRE